MVNGLPTNRSSGPSGAGLGSRLNGEDRGVFVVVLLRGSDRRHGWRPLVWGQCTRVCGNSGVEPVQWRIQYPIRAAQPAGYAADWQ